MNLRERKSIRSSKYDKEWVTRNPGKQKCSDANQGSNVPLKKKCFDNRKIDKFCWICHSPGQGKVCSKCPRVYHIKCLKGQNCFETVCRECQQKSIVNDEDGFDVSSCTRLKELLMYAIDRVFAKKKLLKEAFSKWPDNEKNSKLYKIVDVDYFCKKLMSGSYKKPVEFLSDFKWLYHNCFIVYGDKSQHVLNAHLLIRSLQQELFCLEACADCYFYKNSNTVDEATFFSLPCSTPHEVVWAKVKGFNYWPAKCLKVSRSGSATIVFFGTHEFSCVPPGMWFSLSSQTISSQQQGLYCAGIMELFKYNENMKEKFSTLRNSRHSSVVQKVSKDTQTSTCVQEDTNNENDNVPEIVCVTSIENFQGFTEPTESVELKDSLRGMFHSNEPASKIASVSMSFCQEDTDMAQTSADDDIQELLFVPKSSPNSKMADQEELYSPFKTFTSQTSHPNHKESMSQYHTYSVPNDQAVPYHLKNYGQTLNLDTPTLAKLITEQDPQFSTLFQEKSKELIDTMMVQLWAKLKSEIKTQDTASNLTTLVEEAKAVKKQVEEDRRKLQALEDRERELQTRLGNADFLVKYLVQNVENRVQKDTILSDMETKIKNMKVEKAESTLKKVNT